MEYPIKVELDTEGYDSGWINCDKEFIIPIAKIEVPLDVFEGICGIISLEKENK